MAGQPPFLHQKADPKHTLKVYLQPCMVINEDYNELTEAQNTEYQKFLLKHHSDILGKLSELYGIQLHRFEDEISCSGVVKSLETLETVWNNFGQRRDEINEDLNTYFRSIECPTVVGVSIEQFHVYTAIDEKSYQIGLIELKPKTQGVPGLPSFIKKNPPGASSEKANKDQNAPTNSNSEKSQQNNEDNTSKEGEQQQKSSVISDQSVEKDKVASENSNSAAVKVGTIEPEFDEGKKSENQNTTFDKKNGIESEKTQAIDHASIVGEPKNETELKKQKEGKCDDPKLKNSKSKSKEKQKEEVKPKKKDKSGNAIGDTKPEGTKPGKGKQEIKEKANIGDATNVEKNPEIKVGNGIETKPEKACAACQLFQVYIPIRIDAAEVTVRIKKLNTSDKTAEITSLTKVHGKLCIWEKSINIPIIDRQQFVYWYQLKTSGWISKTMYEHFDRDLCFGTQTMDIFRDRNCSEFVQKEDLLEGCWVYIENMTTMVTANEIKSAIILLKDQKILDKLKCACTTKTGIGIIKEAVELFHNFNHSQIVFLMYVLAYCVTESDIRCCIGFSKQVALKCIEAFKGMVPENFPSNSKTELTSICHTLCVVAYGYTSPFMIVSYFSQGMTLECLEYAIKSCSCVGKPDFKDVGQCFEKLFSELEQENESALKICWLILDQIEDFQHLLKIAKTVSLMETLKTDTRERFLEKSMELAAEKIKTELQKCTIGSPKALESVKNVLEKVRDEKVKRDVCKTAEDHVLAIIKGKGVQWKESEVNHLHYLLSESFLFWNNDSVFEILACSKTHDVFLKMIDKSKDINQGRSNICIMWLQRMMENIKIKHSNSREKRIAEQYHALGTVLEIKAVTKNIELCKEMNDILKTELGQMEISSVMKSAYEVEKKDNKGTVVFLEHVQEYISQQKQRFKSDILIDHMNILNSSTVDLWSHWYYLRELLSAISLPHCTSLNETSTIPLVKGILRNLAFWNNVLVLQGKHSEKIKQHKTVENMIEVVKKLVNGIQNTSLTLDLAKELLPLVLEIGIEKIDKFIKTIDLIGEKYFVENFRRLKQIHDELKAKMYLISELFHFLQRCNSCKTPDGILCIEYLEEQEQSFKSLVERAGKQDIKEIHQNVSGFTWYTTELDLLEVPIKMDSFKRFLENDFRLGNVLMTKDDDEGMELVNESLQERTLNESCELEGESDEEMEQIIFENNIEIISEESDDEIDKKSEIDEKSDIDEEDYANIDVTVDSKQDIEEEVDTPIVTISLKEVIDVVGNVILPKFKSFIKTNIYSEPTAVFAEMETLITCCNLEEELLHFKNLTGDPVDPKVVQLLHDIKNKQDLVTKANDIIVLCKIFGIDVEEDSENTANAIQKMAMLRDNDNIFLSDYWECTTQFQDITVSVDTDLWDTVHELSRSQALMDFLMSVKNEDLRNLIDAVEEHSEQFIQESTVSDLIRIKSLLLPVLSNSNLTTVEKLMKELKICHSNAEKGLAQMVNTCSVNCNSLKVLYMNVANRGEVTKEIVANIIQGGTVEFHIADDEISTNINYKSGERCVFYNLTDMSDLHSRVLLISNTESSNDSSGQDKRQNLQCFIRICELVLDTYSLLQSLHQLGHFVFQRYLFKTCAVDAKDKVNELCNLVTNLENMQEQWQNDLEFSRKQMFFLNFIHSKQLCILNDYFQYGTYRSEAISIMQYIKPNFCENSCPPMVSTVAAPNDDNSVCKQLEVLGRNLHNALEDVMDIYIPFPSNEELWQQIENIDARVENRNVYVAHIDVQSMDTIPVLLSLYANTTKLFPLPNEVLFCETNTTWEELALLINRCMYKPGEKNLYCIAGVEKLQQHIQFQLVQCISALEQLEEDDYLLAVICRSVSHDNFLSSLSNHVHKAPALGHHSMKICLQEACKDMYMISSELPGQGKTELVYTESNDRGLGVVSIPISGPLTKEKLVGIVKSHEVHKYETLHLDIGNVKQPQLLDCFIFEYLVLKCALAGTECVHLTTKHVAIEVANTLNHVLKDSLHVSSSFKRVHKSWTDFDDFVISQEPESSVQIVSKYLSAVESDSLGTCEVKISESSSTLCSDECKRLLKNFFREEKQLSFTIVNVFLEVLADQLRKFSVSQYFRISCLTAMLGDEKSAKSIRNDLVTAISARSKDFSCRSIATCKATQDSAMQRTDVPKETETEAMVSRVDGMVRWADSNHLFVLFQSQDSQTVSSIYREVTAVPIHVKKLLETQSRKDLPDFNQFSQEQLQNILEKLVCTSLESLKIDQALFESYALTPDNILKMVLVMLRIRNRIPVILMGETGCGKTTLVKYLGTTCGVNLNVFPFHAGISEQDIKEKVMEYNDDAIDMPSEEYWVFLDEINTCDHLGMLKEIICNKSCDGHQLAPNLVVIAACNPYRLRNENQVYTAGLEGKAQLDEFSRLVYRVHPLPEAMIDYVWDYGTLHKQDENTYIERMLQFVGKEVRTRKTIAQLLSYSQDFIRQSQKNDSAVSLRDIHRCRTLILWFINFLKEKEKFPRKGSILVTGGHTSRAIRLALSHCYEVRLTETSERVDYWRGVADIFGASSGQTLMDKVHYEQMDILNRMVLPKGIAKNAALRENVFVLFVCILNRIPVFLVGKPGCSKSLSVQLLRSNLRGADSEDEYLRTLPEIYTVSYQGSESSTSEGILKVFEKAEKYKEHCKKKNQNVLPVVLLDEVGLAEISHFNPLKVLHTLMEPSTGMYPEVAVVGISNWALDAAKMNRAVHLSRPELTVTELINTGKAIRDGLNTQWNDQEGILKQLANAYYDYQNNQAMRNFHGLRDYYSLVKYVCMNYPTLYTSNKREEGNLVLQKGIQRNFGGYNVDEENFALTFTSQLQKRHHLKEIFFDAEKLIKENLEDKDARHLMVITNGDYSLGIIAKLLKECSRNYQIIFGSQFEDDLSEDYNYRILSKIILCMEQGIVLILKDLEGIYGSLYDMLNQNYTTVGLKRNCRIALGAHSNPMCVVHDDFRCIVMEDVDKVDYSDPPFLNRFEKQVLRFQDLLHTKEKICIARLMQWSIKFSSIRDKPFRQDDAFLGFHKESLPSLLHQMQTKHTDISEDELLHKCKLVLLQTCPPDAILRLSCSQLADDKNTDIESLQDNFFSNLMFDSITQFVKTDILESSKGRKIFILTRSNINTDLRQIVSPMVDVQVERLSSFKSEKQLSQQISSFFGSSQSVLLLQCTPNLDSDNVLLMKLLLESNWEAYALKDKNHSVGEIKHVFVVMHLNRQDDYNKKRWQFDYTNNWEILTIDRLEKTKFPLRDLLGSTTTDLLLSHFVSLEDMIKQGLIEAFSCFCYASGEKTATSIWKSVAMIKESKQLLIFIKDFIFEDLKSKATVYSRYNQNNWQVQVAGDTVQVFQGFPLVDAWKMYLHDLVRNELILILWFLESHSVWQCFIDLYLHDHAKLKEIWHKIFDEHMQGGKLGVPVSRAPESMEILNPPLALTFPFSYSLVEEMKEIGEVFSSQEINDELESLYEIQTSDRTFLIRRYKVLLEKKIQQHVGSSACESDDLMRLENDFYNICSYFSDLKLEENFRIKVTKLYIESKFEQLSIPYLKLSYITLTWALQHKKVRNLLKLASLCGPTIQNVILEALEHFAASNPQGTFEMADNENPAETAEECIVDSLCQLVLPTQSHLETFENPDVWFHKASQLVSFASKVSFFPEPLHFLRFCIDVYTLLPEPKMNFMETLTAYCESCCEDNGEEIMSEQCQTHDNSQKNANDDLSLVEDRLNIDTENLEGFSRSDFREKETKVSDAENGLSENYLDSLKGFKRFQSFVSKLEDVSAPDYLQRLTCQYFARCIDANSESPRLVEICQELVKQNLPDASLTYVGPILHRLAFNLNIVKKYEEYLSLDDRDIVENILDKMLRGIFFPSLHPLIGLCLDILERILEKVVIMDKNSFHIFQTAAQFIQGVQKYSLQYIVCAAFCRLYLRWFHCFCVKNISDVVLEHKNFLQRFSSILERSEDDVDINCVGSELQLYVLKLFHQKSLKELKSTINHLEEAMPCFKSITWPCTEWILGIGFNGMSFHAYYETAKILLNDDKLDKVIESVRKEPNCLEGAIAALAEEYHWKRLVRTLSDTEQHFSAEVCEQINTLNGPIKTLVEGILGVKPFYHRSLNASSQWNYTEVAQGSFILHITTLQAMLGNKHAHESVWAHLLKDEIILDTRNQGPWSKTFVAKCTCDNMICTKDIEPKHCNICSNTKLEIEELTVENNSKRSLLHDIVWLFQKSCVLGCIALGLRQEKEDLTHQHFQETWINVRELLKINEKEMVFFLHSLLEDTKECSTIADFTSCVQEKLLKIDVQICAFKNKIFDKTEGNSFIAHIEEAEKFKLVTTRNCMFTSRKTKKPCLENLLSRMAVEVECDKQNSFLELILSQSSNLSILNYLPSIIKWYLCLHRYVHHKKNRKETENQTCYDFIHSAPSLQDAREKAFSEFKQNWDKLQDSKTLSSLIPGVELKEIYLGSAISDCIIQDTQHPVFQVIQALCTVQNDFLKNTARIALNGNLALAFMCNELTVVMPYTYLHTTPGENFIKFEWTDDLLRHCQNSTLYGNGQWIQYDFYRIEREMADGLLLGKSYLIIDDQFPLTIYQNEMFHWCKHILSDIRKKVKQRQLPDHIKPRLKKSVLDQHGQQSVKTLLNFLEVVISFLHRTGGNSSESVGMFASKYGIDETIIHSTDICKLLENEICLGHIVLVYEMVEEESAAVSIESLSNQFSKPLNETVKKQVDSFLRDHLNAQAVLTAVRRYTVRYISSDVTYVKPHESMNSLICHPSMWSGEVGENGCIPNGKRLCDVFPSSLLAEHIKELHDYINQILKIHEDVKESKVSSKPRKIFPSRKKKNAFTKT